jgi:hypothetical protein
MKVEVFPCLILMSCLLVVSQFELVGHVERSETFLNYYTGLISRNFSLRLE